jgi:hypothetical protein
MWRFPMSSSMKILCPVGHSEEYLKESSHYEGKLQFFFIRGKIKLAYFIRDKDLFTLIIMQLDLSYLKRKKKLQYTQWTDTQTHYQYLENQIQSIKFKVIYTWVRQKGAKRQNISHLYIIFKHKL